MKQMVSVLLSFLLLLSSSGLAYAEHYCGEFKMVSKVTLGEADLSCGMQMPVQGCEGEAEEPHCCDNEYTQVDTDDHFAKVAFDLDLETEFQYFQPALVETEMVNDPESSEFINFDHGPPPRPGLPLYILFESYLI